ncbi:hypothetical protein AB0I82_03735 [Streptomyces sp. NPDC050315]|uniref:hypothetical protein n=1 Tax=Streptomyces sp. NPDC050315 TaxID=3155039 RepID=UPI00342C1F6D
MAVVVMTAAADDRLRHTVVEVSTGGCGSGWGRPRAGVAGAAALAVHRHRSRGGTPME